jgi:transposase
LTSTNSYLGERPDGGAAPKAAIEAVGATLLYLQPYSPDLNPIELAFAKFKTGPRKAAERSKGIPDWPLLGR